MIRRLFNFFKIPRNLAILNAILIALAIAGNTYIQVFCIPVTWATIALTICCLNIIFSPLLIEKKYISTISSFINGVAFSILLYCIFFLEHLNFLSALLIPFGIGFLIFIPYFFLGQLVKAHFIKPAQKSLRYSFLGGIVFSIICVLLIHFQFSKAMDNIKDFEASEFEQLETNYLTERILGMHFLYHVKACEFDGWRPPLHDPILNIGLWLNQRKDPLDVDLETRIFLYQTFFPDNPIQLNCSCAVMYSENYHNDVLF